MVLAGVASPLVLPHSPKVESAFNRVGLEPMYPIFASASSRSSLDFSASRPLWANSIHWQRSSALLEAAVLVDELPITTTTRARRGDLIAQ